MANDELRVAIGLQMLHPQFFGYREASNQGLIFRIAIDGRKSKAESILDVRAGKDKSLSRTIGI